MDYAWNKPVLTFYRQRSPPEKEPFAVVKAFKLGVSKSEKGGYWGSIVAFFPLMGDLDCVSSAEGKTDTYVICWFDDKEEAMNRSFRRLAGVTFPSGIACVADERGKRTYDANFDARTAKLE